MAALDPKLSVLIDAVRDALVRVADDDILPRLEHLDRELADDRHEALRRADDERSAAVQAAVATAVESARADLRAHYDPQHTRLLEQAAAVSQRLQAAEQSAVDARGHAASLTEQVSYLQARLGDLDQMWRAATADRDALAQQSSARVGGLRTALAALDSCSTLTQCLDALGTALAAVSPRSAVLLPRGVVWQLWTSNGLGREAAAEFAKPQFAAPWTRETLGAVAGPVAVAELPDGSVGVHAFVSVPPRESGYLWPLVVGDVVTVIVYADRDAAEPVAGSTEEWKAMVACVVSHARLAIECVTASQLLRSAGVVLNHGVTRASA